MICATMRYAEGESEPVVRQLGHQVEQIHFTDRRAKRPALADLGVHPDVWIDDCPQWLLKDAI